MAWQPAPESLRTLVGCLKDSHNGFDQAVRKHAETLLSQARTSPDFANYLALIFSSPVQPAGAEMTSAEYNVVRSAAGIMLKNTVRSGYKQLAGPSLALIKAAVPLGLQDASPQVRNSAGIIATEMVRRGGLYAWPELLNDLLAMVGNATGTVAVETQEGAMAAIAKICEDNTKVLEREHSGQRPLNFLLPKLIEACNSPVARVRAQTLTAINEFVPHKSQAMLANIDALLLRLFALAPDASADVRRQVCRAFVYLVETRADKLQPHLAGLIDYMVAQQQDVDDEDLACQAAEFWLSAGEHESFWRSLGPFLGTIVPALLDGIVYSGEEIALYGSASDDDDEEDREQDIKPQFARRAAGRSGHSGTAANTADGGREEGEIDEGTAAGGRGTAGGGPGKSGTGGDIDADDNDDDDNNGYDDDGDDDLFDDGADQRWTVRKGCAAALDVLSRDFGDALFTYVLPYLMTNLRHADWPQREAAVLALGAVAEGCTNAVAPHLPRLVPYLLGLLNDPEALVRQITCWTLSRYVGWAVELADAAQTAAYFVPLLEGLLLHMLDRNKKVQEAAASAMATLEEQAGRKLEPFAEPIVQQYVRCFGRYKDRNMYILYDCVQTLAEVLGPQLAAPAVAGTLMPALFARYESVPDGSRELFPLLACFSYVVLSLGVAFAPYAQPVFRRCVTLIHQNLEQALASAANSHVDPPDKDFLVTSLDLLSALIQALGSDGATPLVTDAQPAFWQLLGFCLEDPSDEVRQSAYAVLGDCARFVYPLLRPALPSLLPVLVRQLEAELEMAGAASAGVAGVAGNGADAMTADDDLACSFSVINNACWSAGEIAVQNGKDLLPVFDALFTSLAEILANHALPSGVTENAASALGRLGLSCADRLAPHLASFADDFLTAMDNVEPTDEKATAFQGFTLVVSHNPAAMEKVLLHYFCAIARYEDIHLRNPVKQDLHDVFHKILLSYRELIPQFDTFLGQLEPRDRAALKAQYGL